MAVISESIRIEDNNKISFGDYIVKEKQKVFGFKVGGDEYSIKTHNEITRLNKNSSLLFESVPGSTVHYLKLTEKAAKFDIEGFGNTQVTLELEPSKEYKIIIDDVNVGSTKSNVSGKINFSVELNSTPQKVKIEKVS